jgi:hypothetical protein
MSEENNQVNEWSKRELGALWKRQGKAQNYLSGFVKIGEFGLEQEVRLVIFTNKNKSKNEKAPDFVIYRSEDRQEATPQPAAEATSKAAPALTQAPAVEQASDEEVPELLR